MHIRLLGHRYKKILLNLFLSFNFTNNIVVLIIVGVISNSKHSVEGIDPKIWSRARFQLAIK